MRDARRLPLLLVVAALLLASCAPAAVPQPEGPVLTVVAGPTERRLAGLEGATREALLRAGFPGSFGPAVTDRIAPYRDLSERQALRTAAELGRVAGADMALYVHVARRDRVVDLDRRGIHRQVRVELQLRATLVDPQTGALIWSTRDATRTDTRVEPADVPLPGLDEDPGMRAVRDRSLRSLAAEIVARIEAEGI